MKKKLLIFGIFLCLVITAICTLFIFTAEKHFDGQYFDDGKIVIANNVVIYDENSSPFKILESGSDYIIVDKLQGFDEDSIISSGVSDVAPAGLLRKINRIEQVANGCKLFTSQAAISDAILKCNVSGHGVVKDSKELVVTDYSSKDQRIIDIIQKAFADEGKEEAKKEKISYQDIVDIELQVNFDWDLQVYDGFVYCKAAVNFYLPVNLHLEKSFSAEKTLWPNGIFGKAQLPKFITIEAGIPVVITIDYGLDFDASLKLKSADLQLGVVIDKTVGFEFCTDYGFRGIEEDNSHGPDVDMNNDKPHFSIKTEIRAPELWVEAKLYGLLGLRGSAALGIDLECNLNTIDKSSSDFEASIKLPFSNVGYSGEIDFKICTPIEIALASSFTDNDSIFNFFSTQKSRRRAEDVADGNTLLSSDGIVIYELHEKFGEVEEFASVPSYLIGRFALVKDGKDNLWRSDGPYEEVFFEINSDGTMKLSANNQTEDNPENYAMYELTEYNEQTKKFKFEAFDHGKDTKLQDPEHPVWIANTDYPNIINLTYLDDKDAIEVYLFSVSEHLEEYRVFPRVSF